MSEFTPEVVAKLKGYFNAGDQPTEAQIAEVFDAIREGFEYLESKIKELEQKIAGIEGNQ